MSKTHEWPAVRIIGRESQLERWEEQAETALPDGIMLGSARQLWYDPSAPVPDLEIAGGALVVYLQPGSDMATAVQALMDTREDSVEIEPFLTPESDWATQWRRFFHPIRVSDTLAILPSWYSVKEGAEELGLSDLDVKWIRIEPGQAFGSGTHATTRLCLRALQNCVDDKVPSVLDFGAGSGILTISAAALGAGRVTAIEIDPETTKNFNDNLELNAGHVEGTMIDHRIGSSEKIAEDETFDLVVCNALYRRVGDHFPALARSVAAGGRFLYSGFLNEEREEITQRIESELGMKIENQDSEEEWGALVAVR
jgi:ribosomal protein L11 methyltransferase